MKYRILGLVFLLAACGPIPQSPCVNPGVDIERPNFYTAHDYGTLDAYYGCVYLNAGKLYADEPFYRAYYGKAEYLRQDAQYQWNLWRQLYTRTKPALEIERLWLDYYAQQSINRQQLDAAEYTAYQAERAAYEAHRARHERKRNERHERKDTSGFNYTPPKLDNFKFAPTPVLELPAAAPTPAPGNATVAQ